MTHFSSIELFSKLKNSLFQYDVSTTNQMHLDPFRKNADSMKTDEGHPTFVPRNGFESFFHNQFVLWTHNGQIFHLLV